MGLSISRLLASRGAILSLADMNEDGLVKAIESLESHEGYANSRPDWADDQETPKNKPLGTSGPVSMFATVPP